VPGTFCIEAKESVTFTVILLNINVKCLNLNKKVSVVVAAVCVLDTICL